SRALRRPRLAGAVRGAVEARPTHRVFAARRRTRGCGAVADVGRARGAGTGRAGGDQRAGARRRAAHVAAAVTGDVAADTVRAESAGALPGRRARLAERGLASPARIADARAAAR